MSKTNKEAREEMIKIYGAECFIDKLHLRDDKGKKYKGKSQHKKMKQLTYHHIKEKSKGGKATVENGALLSVENHMWFNQQSKQKQKELNEAFQEYKLQFASLKFKEKGIEVEKLQQDDEVGIELPEELERGYIELEDMTLEDLREYNELKRKRNERTLKKMGYKPVTVDIDRDWQREIFEINLDETRGR